MKKYKDFREFFAFAIFVLKHPDFWILNYKYDKNVDLFISLLIDNRHDVEVLRQTYYVIDIKYKGNIFSLWRCNRWHAYLTDCHDKHGLKLWEQRTPSRLNAWRFYKTFDNDFDGFEYYENLSSYLQAFERPKDAADTF